MQSHFTVYIKFYPQDTSNFTFLLLFFKKNFFSFYCISSHFVPSQETLWISPGDLQLSNARWHLKHMSLSHIFALSHVVSPCSSLTVVIKYGFPSLPQRNVCASLSHRHRTSHRGSSISSCPDTSGSLPHTQTPPTSNTLQSGATHRDKTSENGVVLEHFQQSVVLLFYHCSSNLH